MKKKILHLLILTIILSFFPMQASAETTCTHTWSDWEVYTEPTCVEPGKQMRYCLDCYEEEYAELPATGEHEWDNWYTVKAATIKKTGIKERECYICGETQTKTTSKLKPYIRLSKKTVKLQTSKTYSLKIRYAKGDSIKKCTSSNKKIATVTKKGKIKAKKKGTATITVVLKSGKRAKCKVTVSAKKKKAGSNNSSSNGTVYWTPNGAVYHSTKNCPTLSRSRTIYSGPLSSCPKPRACKVCY